MKKYLYILKNINLPLVLFENNKLKYFNYNGENSIEELEEYLKDKLIYNHLKIIKEEEVIYYGEEYKVVLVDIIEPKGEKDESIFRPLISIKSNELSYKDLKLIELFYTYQSGVNNLKEIKLNRLEKDVTLKNVIIALVIALISVIFLISGNNINYLGISVPIIVILFCTGSLYSIGNMKKINYLGIYFIGVGILLSITYAVFTNITIRGLNLIIIPISLVLGLYLINFKDAKFNTSELISNSINNLTVGIFNNSHVGMIRRLFKEKKFINFNSSKYKGIINGIFISIPLLVVLIALLAASDEIFARIFENLVYNTINEMLTISAQGSIIKIGIFTIIFFYVYHILSSFKFIINKKYKKNTKKLDKNMVNTILVLINMLYLVFTYIQIKYLYIKYSTYNLTAEEYSNYARSGFFQLTAVVVLNIIIIIYFKNKIENSTLTCGLNTLMTVISINMGLSSLYKMSLYIIEYGLTELRFITSIFIIFILIMLILIAGSLWRNIDLLKYSIIIGSILYLLINFCNMDKIIAQYNLNGNIEKLDIRYISTLSLDSYEVVSKAYEDGKLTKKQFDDYKKQKVYASKWYEYNYYNNK